MARTTMGALVLLLLALAACGGSSTNVSVGDHVKVVTSGKSVTFGADSQIDLATFTKANTANDTQVLTNLIENGTLSVIDKCSDATVQSVHGDAVEIQVISDPKSSNNEGMDFWIEASAAQKSC